MVSFQGPLDAGMSFIVPPPSQTPKFALAGLALLHPGPFFTCRCLCRRYQYKIPSADKALQIMRLLETYDLGHSFTLKKNIKGFFKALPCESLQDRLHNFGVVYVEYKNAFSERDPKLEEPLHDKIKALYPYPESLPQFYAH